MMNLEAQQLFDELVKLESAALNDEQKAFLIARRGYLSPELKARYADFLPNEDGTPGYAAMELPALVELATSRGIKVPKDAKKKAVVKLLVEQDEDNEE